MKKMLSLALALIMALALCVPTFAANDTEPKTITIANSIAGETYKAYKVFDLTKAADAVAGVNGSGYAYTIDEDSEFFVAVVKFIDAEGVKADAEKYEGTVGLTLTKSTEGKKWNVIPAATMNAAAFAEHLNKFVLANKDLTFAASVKATDIGATLTVEGAGYYFVDSSLGALCALDTADSVTVYEKNAIPTIVKEVKEDSTEKWGAMADADYAQTVEYRLIVNTGTDKAAKEENPVQPDSSVGNKTGVDEVYTIVDTIPAYLHFNNDIVVKKGDTEVVTNYEVTDVVEDENGTVVTIKLDATKDPENTDYYIYYTVKVGTVEANKGHTNIAVLTYKAQTSQDSATLYTWDLPIYKYTMKNDQKVDLANAKFTLHKEENDKTLYVVANLEGTVYNFNNWTEDAEEATEFVSPATGEFTVRGLDADTYILTETEAPAGYNALTAPITVVIESNDDGSEYAFALTHKIRVNAAAVDRVEVENNTGIELPSTGGVGTTIFYTVGGLMMAAAVVLFVTKKKLAVQE